MYASIARLLKAFVILMFLINVANAAQPLIAVDPNSLGANKADIGFISTINGNNHMDVVINPGGSGCPAGQFWDVNVGGCTAAITLRTVSTSQACSCTCPGAGSCTASQSGTYPVYGWRIPPAGAEQVSGNGPVSWGSCQMVTNACTAATPPPSGGNGTPPPSGTVFIIDAFICNAGHPDYPSGPLANNYKDRIINAYRQFNYSNRCPEQAGFVYWQQQWLNWANEWLSSNPNGTMAQALENKWAVPTKQSMDDAARQNGENSPSFASVMNAACSDYAYRKYGVKVNATYIPNSGSSCIVN